MTDLPGVVGILVAALGGAVGIERQRSDMPAARARGSAACAPSRCPAEPLAWPDGSLATAVAIAVPLGRSR